MVVFVDLSGVLLAVLIAACLCQLLTHAEPEQLAAYRRPRWGTLKELAYNVERHQLNV